MKFSLPSAVHGPYTHVNSHLVSLCKERNSIETANSLLKTMFPAKTEPFQAIKMPPEAPIEGRKAKLFNVGGQIFFKNCKSKNSFLVSWKHTISQEVAATVSYGIPFPSGIHAPDLPTQHTPISKTACTHLLHKFRKPFYQPSCWFPSHH